MEQLAANSLELALDLYRHVVAVAAWLAERSAVIGTRLVPAAPVEGLPGGAKHLALSQTEHEDQNVGGVERLAGVAGGFQERTCLLARPGGALPLAQRRQAHEGSHILGD